MKIKQSNKMKPSISKAVLILGCLFAVISLYGQSAPSASPEQASAADAGKFCRHQVSIWGAGGFSTLYYDPNITVGDWSPQLSGAAGLGYTFYFSKYFGILVGGEVALYNAKMKVDGLTNGFDIVDRTGIAGWDLDAVDANYSTRLDNYEETQQLLMLNVPVAIQFQTGGKHKFFASLGAKFGVYPISATYKTEGTLVTSAYYPLINQYFNSPIYLGYGAFDGKKEKEDIDFDIAYMGTVEAGVKWKLSRVLSLYTGLYFEYGFNDIVKDGHNKEFLAYNESNPANFKTNSVLTSQYNDEGKTKSFVDQASPIAAGIKLRLGMDLCGSGKQKAPKDDKPAPAPQPTPAPAPEPEPAPAPQPPKVKPVVPPKQVTDDLDGSIRVLSDEEIEEDLRRAVSEYGSSVKGTVNIELEGYELDQSSLSPRMERILDDKIDKIRSAYGTNISIICEGHTCNAGNAPYNMKLGQKRAEVVRQYLIKKGFSANKVVAISKGQTLPIAPNDNEVNRKKNRRVVLIVKD